MAQLNPNFEIDFSDINSYEQIQLINDTQLAKENLLMHRAYQEPADDEIIRNHFSSFTFVDFCPKLFTIKHLAKLSVPPLKCPGPHNNHDSSSVKYYELETFSDLFERINKWLKLNKDWRVVSMETLVFDCKSHFNYLKSSIQSSCLPQNTRGLRLFLSPSKSRFSGPQKIGCINVVPRKLSGSHTNPTEQPVVYETLGDISNRLNELLLSRPIEGRILSVETITLPMFNGYVNTESNYFMDSKLNLLYQCTYNSRRCCCADVGLAGQQAQQPTGQSSSASSNHDGHCLIDILRVYYEFGPMVGGLVNLIDFIPRFYSPTPTTCASHPEPQTSSEPSESNTNSGSQQVPKEVATESLTRLIRRSLAWFESERKRVLAETKPTNLNDQSSSSSSKAAMVNLKVCNLQVHHKTLLRHQLLDVDPTNVIDSINTRSMLHEPMRCRPPIVCNLCSISTGVANLQDWCSHLVEQTQIYQLKFVRLAYVVPVHTKYAKSSYPMRLLSLKPAANASASSSSSSSGSSSTSSSSSSSSSSASSSHSCSPKSGSPIPPSQAALDNEDRPAKPSPEAGQQPRETDNGGPNIDTAIMKEILSSGQREEWMKQAALAVVCGTNERHRRDEQSHQLAATDSALNDAPIGQLTYRLFAPCQLVKSSSCFSINPVNSSSPLSRRGSLDLNGSGCSSDEAPGSLLASLGHSQTNLVDQSASTSSSGPFFPHLNRSTSDFLSAATGPLTDGTIFGGNNHRNSHHHHHQQQHHHHQETNSNSGSGAGNSRYFASNEFELVDAIKRRMEVYVTTNSMKVIAGETLLINLSDSLSCLSTAIEQTLIKAPSMRSRPSTWVCVYVLYAAVDEPHLASHLLAYQLHQQQHQKPSRQLELINEEHDNEADDDGDGEPIVGRQETAAADMEPHFDDDFKCEIEQRKKHSAGEQSLSAQLIPAARDDDEEQQQQLGQAEEEEDLIADFNSAANIYNSAYDRTVALPTSPDNSDTTNKPMEPIEVLGSQVADYLWLDETDLAELQQQRHYETFQHLGKRRSRLRGAKKRSRSKANKMKLHDHESQCSLI